MAGEAQEKLHTRVTQAQLVSQEVSRRGVGPSTLSNSKKKAIEDYNPIMEAGQEAHWEVVQRILFLYAKLNPGQGYVQGMNEIIGPIYYVLASDSSGEWRQHAEADCFFCFTNLMSDIRDGTEAAVQVGRCINLRYCSLFSVCRAHKHVHHHVS